MISYNDWDELNKNKLVEGSFTASIKVSCSPHKQLNLRPLITINGDIEEWHLMISDPPEIDWKAVSNGPKPLSGQPIATSLVIRFHPDDVDVPIDTQKELSELQAKYDALRYPADLAVCEYVRQKPS